MFWTGPSTCCRALAWILVVGGLLAACRDREPPEVEEPVEETTTRFDNMNQDAPRKKVSPIARQNAVDGARHELDAALDGAMTLGTAVVLGEEPHTMKQAAALGTVAGVVQQKGDVVTLRLADAKGPVFASFETPRLETQLCWTSIWYPDWAPVIPAGSGVGLEAEAGIVWWRFERDKGAPFLVRFDPDGIAVWRPNDAGTCYRGESLLGLIGGGLRTVDYLSPVVPTDGASPDESEETRGTKPLRIDILKPRGKEIITARDGVVELRTARKKRIRQWKTTLPRGAAACTQAAYHRFEGDPVQLFFEIEFTDDESCDEGWGRREVQQTLFELREGELVPIVSGGTSATGNEEGDISTAVQLDLVIGTGDGRLHYVGSGTTKQSVIGGDELFDCSAWAADLGLDAADTGYSEDQHSGTWTFEVDETVTEIGAVSAMVRTYQCSEAQ